MLTSALKDCISDKIRILLAEGKPRDEAIAIAYSMCGEASKTLLDDALKAEIGALYDALARADAPTPPHGMSGEDAAQWRAVYRDALAETHDELLAETAAWGALHKDDVLHRLGRKSAAGEGYDLIRGWAMLFTDADDPDVDDQFFDGDTETLLDYYPNAPLWYEHGEDAAYGWRPIGQRAAAREFRRGVVLEHRLYHDDPQYTRTAQEIDDGLLTYSTDSILHYVEQGFNPQTGRLGVWFAAGCSLTKRPAEPALGIVTRKAYSQAVKSATVEAREAQDAARRWLETQNPIFEKGRAHMDALLKVLAGLFGVEPERAAVKSAVADLTARMADMPEGGEPPADAPQVDMATLLQVLGLAADAPAAEVVARLNALIETLSAEPAPADATMRAGKSPDPAAVKSAAEWLADNAPAQTFVPYHVNGGDERQPAPGQRNTRYNGVRYNRGVKAPGLAELVLGVVGKKSEGAMKAMGYSVGPNGGYLLRQEVAPEMIELFRANTVVDKLGATYVPMNGIETLTYRKQLTGSTATYRGEGQSGNQSNPTFGIVQLQLKELFAGTRLNRRLLKNSVENLERLIRGDLEKALSLRADLAALRGTGGIPGDTGASGAEPRGILNTTGVTSTALATNGAVPTIKHFVDGWGRIEDANVPTSDSWGIAFSPRTKRTMENLTDTTGQLLPVARWSQGHKYEATTQIPNNSTVGSATDCSEAYLGAWEYLIYGVGQDVEIIVDESVYRLQGEVYIEATIMHDVGVAQPVAFQVLTGIRA